MTCVNDQAKMVITIDNAFNDQAKMVPNNHNNVVMIKQIW